MGDLATQSDGRHAAVRERVGVMLAAWKAEDEHEGARVVDIRDVRARLVGMGMER